MKVTVKDVSLISSCFHCNKLGLVALADCTVISPCAAWVPGAKAKASSCSACRVSAAMLGERGC